MKNKALMNASSLIAKRNLTEKVISVNVNWDDECSKLVVTYYVDGIVHDDERELCEITLSELLAEFSDVKLADSQCVRVTGQSSRPENMTGLVYRRPQNITDSN